MNKNLSINIIKILLTIILISLPIIFIQSGLIIIYNISTHGTNNNISYNFLIYFVSYPIYFLITYNLIKIIYSIYSTPFCVENVKRFKTIGYSIFPIAILDGIINFKKTGGLQILNSQYGSLKPSFFLYIILAFTALILAEIFKKAVEIKKENDLTI